MPELPEVETIRRNLQGLILQKELGQLESYTPEVLVNPEDLDPSGQTLQSLDRKGKYLVFNFDQASLLVHLRMTGKLLFAGPGTDPEDDKQEASHLRARLTFADGSRLLFDDLRRFGRISLFPLGEAWRDKGFAGLGPDAIGPDWTWEDFWAKLQRRPKSSIKGALLDQTLVAGLGNIYADEVLFRAGIRPNSLTGQIPEDKVREIYRLVPCLLEESIGLGGTSFRDYVNSFGRKGHFQLSLAVYQKEGQACPKCGAIIEKIQVAGRGTRYCPDCQKAYTGQKAKGH
ncbi:MAG: bifunctional DNA-formamidopyrimidine glycosylase/DNA-(apurinic or apyrimidinic site) lyase [Eubacteriales bacterium]|nr:bifunctional DNA-formamidopyrimidine glycosylase/DNA-(apurinic or apyrimidinic site) lyase [Clostridiales bacterium]MDY5836670.1 bifunctional DNA-formamidopyrimidine glycosylase/DNA-(apurinic or apyrimidinic site) lyase [Eubacteriales bacterium]